MANSIGTVRRMFARHSVMVQLYTLMAVGTAITSVVVAKKKPKYGCMPDTYMWCAQTTKLKTPMATMAHTIIR